MSCQGESPAEASADTDDLVRLDVCGFGEVGQLHEDGTITALGSCLLRGANQAAEFNGRRIVDVQGELRFDGGGRLERFELDHLERASGILVRQNESLKSIGFPALVEVRNYLSVGNNPALETIEAPSLVALRGSIFFQNNPLLDVCSVDALIARLQPPLPEVRIDGTCADVP